MKRDEFNLRIRRQRTLLGLTQKQLGKAVGVSHVTIYKWEEGSVFPKARYIGKLATALEVNVSYLLTGDEYSNGSAPAPLLEPGAALSWVLRENVDYSVRFAHSAEVGPRAFALQMTGDSMRSLRGKSIPEGAIIVVDPDAKAEHGSVVVVQPDNMAELTVKQLIIDGSHRYLKSFNPDYRTLPWPKEATLLGVVKQSVQNF